MSTSPGPGTGSGTSSQRRTSGPPGSVMTTARMGLSFARWPVCRWMAEAANCATTGLSAQPRAPQVATECHRTGALGIEIACALAYARIDGRTPPACAPTPEDQGGRPVTTNNDTPQIFGPGAGIPDAFAGDWRDILAGRPAADPHEEDDPSGSHEDQAHRAADGWAGWGEPGEPETAGPGYPQPAFYPREEEYPAGPGYLPVPRDRPPARNHQPAPGQPGYPQGPGYAVDAGYATDADYARQLGYPQDPGYGPEGGDYPEDAGYLPDLGFVADAGPVP